VHARNANSARLMHPTVHGEMVMSLMLRTKKIISGIEIRYRDQVEEIRVEEGKTLSARLRDDILGYRPDRRLADRDAVSNELVSLREQLALDDFPALTELLSTPAPLHQFEAIAALAARGFNRSDTAAA